MTNGYGDYDAYGTYGEGNLSPYEMLMQMKSWNKAIYMTIQDIENGTEAQISVLEGEIALKVSQTDYNGETIASLVQISPTAINIMSNALNLSGFVTFSSLTASGTTQIDGARITTGYISANRLEANVILSKLIQAGGIDAQYITSGTISANRLSANAIETTLINAGGINASLITAGTLSGDRIYGGTISGVLLSGVNLNTSNNVTVGNELTVGASTYGARINLGIGTSIDASADGSVTVGTSELYTSEGQVVTSRTSDLSFGWDNSTKKLYVTINGIDRGTIQAV